MQSAQARPNTVTKRYCIGITLRVQVPNNHILTRNLYYDYYYPKPKYLIIGYMDPLGYIRGISIGPKLITLCPYEDLIWCLGFLAFSAHAEKDQLCHGSDGASDTSTATKLFDIAMVVRALASLACSRVGLVLLIGELKLKFLVLPVYYPGLERRVQATWSTAQVHDEGLALNLRPPKSARTI